MKPYYSRGGITIYHADCLDILPHLPSQSVDLVLTDPPYGISYRAKSRKLHADLPTGIANDKTLNALRDAMPLMDPLLKPDRHVYVFAAPARVGECGEAVGAWWKIKNVLVWDKGNAGSKGDCLAGYSLNWEAILYASKGRRALEGPRPRCVIRYDWQGSRDPVHPTVKPVALMSLLMAKSSLPGEMVLDPFMGSGVVMRAAAELGRRAVGIEVEERYCEAAVRRLEGIQAQQRKQAV